MCFYIKKKKKSNHFPKQMSLCKFKKKQLFFALYLKFIEIIFNYNVYQP